MDSTTWRDGSRSRPLARRPTRSSIPICRWTRRATTPPARASPIAPRSPASASSRSPRASAGRASRTTWTTGWRISSAHRAARLFDGDGGARRRLERAWRASLLAGGVQLGLEGQRRRVGLGDPHGRHGLPRAGEPAGDAAGQRGTFRRARAPWGERFSIEAGARVERARAEADPALADTDLYFAYHRTRSTSADDTLVSGNAGLLYRPRESWELSARLGSAERAPDPAGALLRPAPDGYRLGRQPRARTATPDAARPRRAAMPASASPSTSPAGWRARRRDHGGRRCRASRWSRAS